MNSCPMNYVVCWRLTEILNLQINHWSIVRKDSASGVGIWDIKEMRQWISHVVDVGKLDEYMGAQLLFRVLLHRIDSALGLPQSALHNAFLLPVDDQLTGNNEQSQSRECPRPLIWGRLAIFAVSYLSAFWFIGKGVALQKKWIAYLAIFLTVASGLLFLASDECWSGAWWV